MARPLTNALQNFMMSKQARQQEVAQQQQQDRQSQTRDLLGQMVMGGDPGNLAQVNPEAFIMGQNYLQQQEQGQTAARQNALVTDLRQQYAQTQDPEVLRQLMAADPETAGRMQEQMGIADDDSRMQAINQATALARVIESKPDEAMEYYTQNLADNPAFQGIEDELQAGDYEGVLQGLGVGVTALGGKKAYDKFAGIDSDATDPSAVREYQFYQNLTPEQQRQYLTVKRASQTFREGDVTMGVDPTDPSRAQAITEEGRDPQTQAERQEELTEQSATKAATERAATSAIETSQQAFDQLSDVQGSISTLDEAIALMESDDPPATGTIMSRLPSVRQASIKLDNLQNRLGLNVVSETTFGALSEKELELAMKTALPDNLEGEELTQWLKDKRQSQDKLANYLEEAAVYLGTPGNTVSDFLQMKRDNQNKQPEDQIVLKDHPIYGTITEADIQTTMENNGVTRAQVLEMLNSGGAK